MHFIGKSVWEGDDAFGPCEIITSHSFVCNAKLLCFSQMFFKAFFWLDYHKYFTQQRAGECCAEVFCVRGGGRVMAPPQSREDVHRAGVSMHSWGSAIQMKVDQLDRRLTLPTDWITNF